MYKVSVILPIYNMEKYIDSCMKTIIEQTIFSELEVVCVNDGSADTTEEILRDYADMYKNIVVINQKNAGVGVARNNGMKAATGEFIAFMDPDDYYLETDTLEVLYNKAIEQEVYICGGSLSEDHNDGWWIRKEFEGIYKKYTFTEEKLIEYKDYQFDFGFYRFIYNREFLIKNDIFFPPYIRFQDPPFFVKAMITAGKFYAVPNYTYCYRYGHQKLVWHEKRICHLMKGHIDDLKMSSEAGLGELHALTLHRLVNISKDVITQGIVQKSRLVLELLNEAEQSVNIDILPENAEITTVAQFYFDYFNEAEENKGKIKYLRKSAEKLKTELANYKKELKQVKSDLKKTKAEIEKANAQLENSKNNIKKIKASRTYKVGSGVLYFPKKVKKMLKK